MYGKKNDIHEVQAFGGWHTLECPILNRACRGEYCMMFRMVIMREKREDGKGRKDVGGGYCALGGKPDLSPEGQAKILWMY